MIILQLTNSQSISTSILRPFTGDYGPKKSRPIRLEDPGGLRRRISNGLEDNFLKNRVWVLCSLTIEFGNKWSEEAQYHLLQAGKTFLQKEQKMTIL